MQINKEEFKKIINEKPQEEAGPLTTIMVCLWLVILIAISLPLFILLTPIVLIERYIKRRANARKIRKTYNQG